MILSCFEKADFDIFRPEKWPDHAPPRVRGRGGMVHVKNRSGFPVRISDQDFRSGFPVRISDHDFVPKVFEHISSARKFFTAIFWESVY